MKPKDFMINDWVKWTFDIEPKHRQILSIITEENADGSKEYYADLGDGEIYKDLIPIPLTEEILEKNELPQYQWIKIYLQGEYGNITDFSKEIKYVHQLQQILRLCGREELADNFKI